jgi:hypothetical protein
MQHARVRGGRRTDGQPRERVSEQRAAAVHFAGRRTIGGVADGARRSIVVLAERNVVFAQVTRACECVATLAAVASCAVVRL